jgi:SAM-dependent methyltransferase
MGKMLFLKGKLSTKNLKRLCQEHRLDEKILVVHSQDVPYEEFFPNTITITSNKSVTADVHADPYYRCLEEIANEEYPFILCTGLLEHIPDSQRFIDELHRILKPGGKLVIAVAAISAIHEGPDDYFRFTPFGLATLFKDWSYLSMKGSCKPFETIAILLQRILFQSEIKSVFIHLFVEFLCVYLPHLDKHIVKQYSTREPQNEETEIDSMMPYEVFAVAIK